MSRIGKKKILLPENVTVTYSNNMVSVKGPKGKIEKTFSKDLDIQIKDKEVNVLLKSNNEALDATHGLSRNLLNNMIMGVSHEFQRTLTIVGVGYKAEIKGKDIIFNLGYSHPIQFKLPDGINCKIEDKQTTVILTSVDNELLGEIAAKIRALKPPEPYKGKGIKYSTEFIKRKVGKSGASATTK